MSMVKERTLKYINNGAIDFYYGLKIETKLNFEDLCNNISKKINESIGKYNIHIKTIFQNNVKQVLSENGFDNQFHIKDADESKIMTEINEITNLRDEICGIDLDFTENGFKIIPSTYVDKYFSLMSNESDFDFHYSKNVYGNVYVNSQKRFILPPIKAELINDSIILLRAILYVFENKSAILRLTLPLDSVDTQPLISNEIDDYIASAETLYGFPVQLENKSIDAMQACFCRFLAGVTKVKTVICFKRIVNILLANHSCMVENIKEIPDNLKEDIYKISAAPVQEREGVSYAEEATKQFDKNSYFFNGIGYVLSNMGKCISIIDNTVLSFIQENFDEDVVFNKIISDLRRNVEFTIIILLLKNVNDSYAFEQKRLRNSKISKVQNDYNRDRIYISMLQTGVYGSVRELTNVFEEKMTFFLDNKNTEDRMSALNSILDGEQAERTIQLQNAISIVGLIFAVIFGLPAINETLSYIRNLCFFIKLDIPYISIENSSFAIWCLTIICLSLFIFCKSRYRKID